jgi:hypothetical protein
MTEIMAQIHVAGVQSYVWCVNEPVQVERLVGWGAHHRQARFAAGWC